jgi:hypothetical protein
VSEGFRHCFERDVTEGRSMSWCIDLDEGNLEDEAMLGLSPGCGFSSGPWAFAYAAFRTATERGGSHSRNASSSPAAVWQTRSLLVQNPTNSDFVAI